MKPILTFLCIQLLVCPAIANSKPPNVLFIAVDDLNDWVGCLGGHPQAKTPNIDRLASRGVLFEQAYCSAPLCNPSRMATMTGLRASTIDIWNNEGRYGKTEGFSWFRDKPEFKDCVTIPQFFRQQGYTSVTGGKIFHQPHGKFSDPISWDHQYSIRHGTPMPKGERLLHGMSAEMAHEYYQDWADWQPLDIPETETADWKTAESAAAFLKREHNKPFFLGCGIFRPHLRWYAPRKYFYMHPLEEIELPVTIENDLDDVPPKGRRQSSGGAQAFGVIREHGEWKKAVQGYLASCSFADACVGVVLDALEASEHADNTVVILCGDHGFHVGEKDRISKLTLWEQGSKTPLIISTPELAATTGKRCPQPVSLVDLYPTLVELCGLPERDGLDGRSIVPLLREPEIEWGYPAVISLRNDHAVRSKQWHYISYADGSEELYDATRDPHQWKNLATEAHLADTKAELRKWLPKNNAKTSHDNATRGANQFKVQPDPASKVPEPDKANSSRKRPNIVILLADDLGSQDLGCYGGPVKTPVLDRLAARGVRFTDFNAGAATCSPSRATLITGRVALRTGIYGVLQDHMHDMHLLEREVTIAEVLQEDGYGTAHFGKWHIGMTSGKRVKPSPTEHGFDYWFGLSNGAQPSHRNPVNFMRNGQRVGPKQGYSCQIVVDDAINWLETKPNPDEPFFLNIWFNEPHSKLAAPDEIVSIYGDLKDEAAIYSATVDNTDRAIGRLVEKLEAMGELENTLIIYSSDHGSYRPDRNGGLTGAKGSYFQGGLRSPGIFFWPDGIRGDRTENTPSGAVDLLPTICGLAGIKKPKGVSLDGADLTPLLVGRGTFERPQPLFWLSPSSGHLATLREGKYTLMGYSGYKLPSNQARKKELALKLAKIAGIDPSLPRLESRVSNTTFSSPEYAKLKSEFVRLRTFQEAWIPAIKAGGFSRFALYDLESDPLQKKDISKQRSKVTSRLKEKMLELYRDVLADAPNWPFPEEDVAEKADVLGRIELVFQLLPLIIQTDSSRVISTVVQHNHAIPIFNGVDSEHHNLTHHVWDPNKIAQIKPIERAIAGEFDQLLTQLKSHEEGGITLLDHTLSLLGSNLGNAASHDPRNNPISLAGGSLNHGGYHAHSQTHNTSLSILYLRTLQEIGVQTESFTTSSGALSW